MRGTSVMPSNLKESTEGTQKRSRTFRLDMDFEQNMRAAVKATVQSVQELA